MNSAPRPSPDELRARAARARATLRACDLCELRCGIDRTAGERAPCGLAAESRTFKRHVSYAEELELIPSYMVYLGGCNFRCKFCVQAPYCFRTDVGAALEPEAAAADFRAIISRGGRTVNLLGGEPSLHLHTILDIAAADASRDYPERLPLVLNSNMYMTPEVIDLLEGVVTLYLADLKFGNDACASDLAGVPRYWDVVTRNLLAAAATTPVLVRHLAMPGHIDCCLKPVADWMERHLPTASFNVGRGYVPAYRAQTCGNMGRCLSADEEQRVDAIIAGYKGRLAA